MKAKHLDAWFESARIQARLSNCPRAQHGCVLVDPIHNTIISTGYNGPQRTGPALCGGDCCLRTAQNVVSGEHVQIGCIHAEMNALCNANRVGHCTLGAHAIITGEPCLMCAKLLFQSGIRRVYVIDGGYSTKIGVTWLRRMDVEIVEVPKEN